MRPPARQACQQLLHSRKTVNAKPRSRPGQRRAPRRRVGEQWSSLPPFPALLLLAAPPALAARLKGTKNLKGPVRDRLDGRQWVQRPNSAARHFRGGSVTVPPLGKYAP